MEESLKARETEENLRRCHAVQQREARPVAEWATVPPGSFNVFLLFNLEAAWDEGHCILALGPVDGPFQTSPNLRELPAGSSTASPGIGGTST